MAAVEFRNDETGYFAWLREHPNGFVLNLHRYRHPEYVVLHRTSCWTISKKSHATGAYTERHYRKVCGATIAEMQEAARDEGRSDGSFSKRCSICGP